MASLTQGDVIAALGPVDDLIVAEIIGMNATAEEFAKAQAWVTNDEALINTGEHLAEGRVGRLVEILAAIKEEAEEDADK
jgi:hypothetical protein